MKLSWPQKALVVLLLLAFAYLVWPSPWRYEHHAGLLVRIDRLRGTTQVLRGQGWETWDPPRPTIEEALAQLRRESAAEDPYEAAVRKRAEKRLRAEQRAKAEASP